MIIWPDNDVAGAKYAARRGAVWCPAPRSCPFRQSGGMAGTSPTIYPTGVTLEALKALLLLAAAPAESKKAKSSKSKPKPGRLKAVRRGGEA